jgi:Tfp pilus assembly protein PilF
MKNNILVTVWIACAFLACGGAKARTAPGRINPDSAEYLMNEGVIYLNMGKLDMAEQKLAESVRKNPNLINAQNALALVYTYKKDFSRAIEGFEKIIRTNPSYYDAYNTLGAIYIELGKYDLAKEKLLIAANASDYLTPENAYVNLAILEMRNNRLDAASRYIEKGIILNNKKASLFNLRGLVEEGQGKVEDALASYRKALSMIAVPDPGFLLNAGRAAMKAGDKKKALDYLEQALGKSNDPVQKQEIAKLIQSAGG